MVREEELLRLLPQNQGETASMPTILLISFSLATCLFLVLKNESCGRSLIFAGQFGDQIKRRAECGERNADGKNPGALPRQRVRSEFIEKGLSCDLRAP